MVRTLLFERRIVGQELAHSFTLLFLEILVVKLEGVIYRHVDQVLVQGGFHGGDDSLEHPRFVDQNIQVFGVSNFVVFFTNQIFTCLQKLQKLLEVREITFINFSLEYEEIFVIHAHCLDQLLVGPFSR